MSSCVEASPSAVEGNSVWISDPEEVPDLPLVGV